MNKARYYCKSCKVLIKDNNIEKHQKSQKHIKAFEKQDLIKTKELFDILNYQIKIYDKKAKKWR